MGGLFAREKQPSASDTISMEVSPVIERQAQLIWRAPFTEPHCPIVVDGFNCTGCAYFMIDAVTGVLCRVGEEMSDQEPGASAYATSDNAMISMVVMQDARCNQFIIWVVDDELSARHERFVSDIVRLELYLNIRSSGSYTMPLWSKLQYMKRVCNIRYHEWDRAYTVVGLSVGGLCMQETCEREPDQQQSRAVSVERRERPADLDRGYSCGPFSRG